MSIEDHVQRRTIDGYAYEVRPLPSTEGLKALNRFIKLASPVLAAIMAGGKSIEAAAADALEQLAANLGDDDIAYYAKTMGTHTTFIAAENESSEAGWLPLTVDQQQMHFAARYAAFFEWLKFSMEVNFGDFFGALAARATAAMATTKTKTP